MFLMLGSNKRGPKPTSCSFHAISHKSCPSDCNGRSFASLKEATKEDIVEAIEDVKKQQKKLNPDNVAKALDDLHSEKPRDFVRAWGTMIFPEDDKAFQDESYLAKFNAAAKHVEDSKYFSYFSLYHQWLSVYLINAKLIRL
jgi:hypothetical protein